MRHIDCPKCGKPLKVPESDSTLRGKCYSCGHKFAIKPTLSADPPAAKPEPAPVPELAHYSDVPGPRSRRPLIIGAVVACVAVLVVGAVLIYLLGSDDGAGKILTATNVQTDPPPPDDKAIGIEEVVSALPPDIKTPNRYALLIGASDYADDRIPDLPACANDAREFYKVLTDPSVGMFPAQNVTLITDSEVTRVHVVDALDDLSRRASKDDLVLIFFSGHGATDSRDQSYWVMHDTFGNLRSTGLPQNEINDLLDSIKTDRLVTLIDACYSAATAQVGGTKSLVDVKKIYSNFAGEGRVVIAASTGEQLSVVIGHGKPGHGYSAFAWHVIEAFKGQADKESGDGDGVMTVTELWAYVKDRTERTARLEGGNQQPQIQGQFGSNFMLSVNADQLRRSLRETTETKALRATRLVTIERMYLEEETLTRDQTQLANRLLNADPETLDGYDAKRLEYVIQAADGALTAEQLRRALELIETPQQRKARLAREAVEAKEREQQEIARLAREVAQAAEQERQRKARLAQEAAIAAEKDRQQKIDDLLLTARFNNKANGRTALTALDELLKLNPTHSEALALRDKIAKYYGPSKLGDTWTNSIGMKFTYIPAGEFVMGSPPDQAGRYQGENRHRVRLTKPFLLGVTEVTQAQWQAVMGGNPSYFKGDAHPVEQVSWHDTVSFCEILSNREGRRYRLPTEAEWEYACRAGTTTAYYTGNDDAALDRAAWYHSNSDTKTHPVGLKVPNAWGVYDMHGNVWEWCSDWYKDDLTRQVMDPKVTVVSPEGRVSRGGGFLQPQGFCRSAHRGTSQPGIRNFAKGFRVVVDLN